MGPHHARDQVDRLAKKKEKPEKPKETLPEFISSMAVVLATGLFIVTFCLQAFEIPSASMVKTLLIGDHVFVDRVSAAPKTRSMPLIPYREIERGDIIVFISPIQPGLHVVKRIIGIPGDRLHLKDGIVYRNGQRLTEPYVNRLGDQNEYRDNFPSVSPAFANVDPVWHVQLSSFIQGEDLVVPPDNYFGMGDNRDVSYDSRFWGFIPRENVIGRPMFIYWSFETPERQYEKTDIGSRVGFIGHIILHFFDETRWRRTLQLVR
jgi:signal peptidase I